MSTKIEPDRKHDPRLLRKAAQVELDPPLVLLDRGERYAPSASRMNSLSETHMVRHGHCRRVLPAGERR